MEEQERPKEKWKPIYTLVLVANAVYIILFYFITTAFS